jgi:hypothetical protein
MNSSRKIRSYLISGILLTIISLKNLDNFSIFYEGIALAIGVAALIMAAVEYMKKTKEEKNTNP